MSAAATEETQRPDLRSHTAEVRYLRDQRRIKVAEGLASHLPYRQMARELDCDVHTIFRDVQVLRRYWRTLMAQSYEAHVSFEFGKLDALERTFTPKALAGDDKAAGQLRWIYERRARLGGWDQPVRVEGKVTVEHTTPLDSEIDEMIRAMRDRDPQRS